MYAGNYVIETHFFQFILSNNYQDILGKNKLLKLIKMSRERLPKKIILPRSSHIEGLSNSHQNHSHPEVRTSNQH